MFTKTHNGCVGFDSSWKSERSLKESGIQTESLPASEVETQAKNYEDAKIQTDPIEQDLQLPSDYDHSSLLKFLRRIEPHVHKELEKNRKSHAFKGYNLNLEEDSGTVSKLHTLSYSAFIEQGLRCTDLAWNLTGSVVAASYGFPEHTDWCDHRGGLCIWNLNRVDLNPSRPNRILELSSCLTCITFHPEKPALIAGGNFLGEVILWNLGADDDPLISTTDTGDSGHRDTVTQLAWIKNPDSSEASKYLLISCGLDGRILVWKQNERTQQLQLINAFVLLAENLPRSVRIRNSNRLQAEIGVIGMSFNCEDTAVFLIATEGGGVFQCSLYSEIPAHAETEFSIPLKSPVVVNFDQHQGQVLGIESSPFVRNIFLTYGSDGEIRIYSLLQAGRSIITFHTSEAFTKVQWSPARPLMLAGVSVNGELSVYDLLLNRSLPAMKAPLTDKSSDSWILKFNHKDHKLLATGTADGNVQIWSLTEQLTTSIGNEEDILRNYGKMNSEG